jgi:putative FmdB family regulatory protein
MALYTFKCEKCNHPYDVIDYKNQAGKKHPCPECDHPNTKLMTAANISLKPGGVGWAKDGYAAEKSQAYEGPEPKTGNRHKRSGRTVVPVRGGLSLQGSKGEQKSDKKPTIKVK